MPENCVNRLTSINFLFFLLFVFFFSGKLLNGQRLLEFSITPDDRSVNQEVRVRVATVWVKVDLRQGGKFRRKKPIHKMNGGITLWIFRLVEPYETYGGGYLNEKVIILIKIASKLNLNLSAARVSVSMYLSFFGSLVALSHSF